MKLQSLLLRTSLLLSAAALSCCYFAPRADAQLSAQATAAIQAPAVPARITEAINETQLVRLKGNVHPLARPEFDQGAVPDSTPMNRMLLLLQRSPQQEAALQQLLADQQTTDSPNFHNWLTPQQFGAQFGPADADIQKVTSWLTRHGFQGIQVAAGKTVIEFSGTAGQVRNAFHTEIHHYLVNGETRQANVADPQIPAGLTPVVAGIVTLHNFPRKSMKRDAGTFTRTADGHIVPEFTVTGTSSTFYVVGPADFGKIYNLPPTTTLDGTGVTIALVADSNINPQDVADFRALFGLSANFSSANVILDGPDPGLNPDEGEADLDAQTAGMVAPGATINLVVSEDTFTALGIDLSAIYIIDNNIASVMSESFGVCEPSLGTTGTQFYGVLWEQAAAQGTSVMVSAGDNGSAGCDNFLTQATAVNGLAVSGIASTPFNVAVGGTDFDDAGNQTTFWSSTNATGTRESALGYIPEIPWNDSCAAGATSANLNTICATANGIAAGSGGPSAVFTKTQAPWQNGITPADGHRDLPDVSLFASDGPNSHSFYLVCQADGITPGGPPSCASTGPFQFLGAGGTSASSPAFAGIMALINQQQGGRQGNPNPILYTIAKSETFSSCNSSSFINPTTPPPTTCPFLDVTKGNDSVPCTGGTLNCSSTSSSTNGVLVNAGTPAWTTGTGYDMATGLGTVNVTNLAAAWKNMAGAFKASTTATQVNGATTPVSISHGTSVTLSATVSGTPTPTGEVSFLAAPPTAVNGGIGCEQPFPATCSQTLNSSGTASFVTTFLPGGSYALKAHYGGDGTFAPSDDPTGVQVTVTKENSSLVAEMLDLSGNVTTSYTYGSGPILRMDVLNHAGNSSNCQPFVAGGVFTGCAIDATGSATVTDTGTSLPESPISINSQGHAEDQIIQLSGGTHTLVVTYGGDISYNASPAVNVGPITVSAAATSTTLTPLTTPVTTGTSVTLTATVATLSNGKGPTGTVTFFDGGTQIATPVSVTSTAATSTTPAGAVANLSNTFTTTGNHSITATYTSGDANYSNSAATAITVMVNSSGSFTVAGSSATVAAGSNATSTITVTPMGGFTGMVNVACPAANLPPGVTCSPNPLAINVTGTTAVTGSLTVAVAAPSSSTSASILPADRKIQWAGLAPITAGGKGWWGLSAIAGFAAILLLLLPGKKRYRTAFALGLACILSFTLGCGGGYGGGGGGGGTSATTTKISVTSTKVASGTSVAFNVTVTSTGSRTPTGSVQLYDGTFTLGTAATLSNGSATINASGLSVGTHAFSVHYLGDTYSTASQSGVLNIAVTGSTTFAITASPAASNGNATVNLTIN